MDLFEIVFILLFILFPILEQVARRRRKAGGGTASKLPETEPEDATPQRESAADMVPDDLWAVLTGESRRSTDAAEEAMAEAEEPWSEAPWEEERRSVEPWEDAAGEVAGTADRGASLEYSGPEAYSLERLDFDPVSLERPIESPEARHRRFHDRIDRDPVKKRRPRRRSTVGRALKDRTSVRSAIVLAEVLGPPRGLE